MFKKLVVIDCRGHILGRLASTVAKELLCGQKVVLVRCEDVEVNGPLYRNKLKYMSFLRKASNSNPRKCSHIHYRSPAKMVWRTIRGMVQHKLPRGKEALSRLRTFEGIPSQFDKKTRVIVPQALRVLRLRPERKVTRLGDLASQVGWKYDDVVERLEARRIAKGQISWETRREERMKFEEARKQATKQLDGSHQSILMKVMED